MRLKCNLVSVRLEIGLFLMQNRRTVCSKCTIGSENRFGHTWWNSLVTWVMWNLVSDHLEIVLVSVQDSCMDFAKRTIGSEIILDAPDETPR